jgi:hypothetical protein
LTVGGMAYALLLFVPVSVALRWLVVAPPTWVFLTSIVAIAVLADWIRRATEQLAERAGSTIGGLLNVSFGNTAELVLALLILSQAQTPRRPGADHRFDHRHHIAVSRHLRLGRRSRALPSDLQSGERQSAVDDAVPGRAIAEFW